MPRDPLLVAEMISAGERIISLAERIDPEQPEADRDRLDALLWNFTVLGEAAAQVSDQLKSDRHGLRWADPIRLRNRIVHGYWSVEIDVLVSTARDDVPALVEALRSVANDL